MVGVGWVVLMDDWLGRGGPAGAFLGFLLGGVLLLPVARTYGRMVLEIQDAGAEIAYTEGVFAPWASFAAAWTMVLAYAIVCPWEAVAVGNLLARLRPAMNAPLSTDRRKDHYGAASGNRARADVRGGCHQLRGDPSLGDLPEHPHLFAPRPLCGLHRGGSRTQNAAHPDPVCSARRRRGMAVDPPRAADRAVLHDGLRVGRKGGRRGEIRIRSSKLRAGDPRGGFGRDRLLLRDHRRGLARIYPWKDHDRPPSGHRGGFRAGVLFARRRTAPSSWPPCCRS